VGDTAGPAIGREGGRRGKEGGMVYSMLLYIRWEKGGKMHGRKKRKEKEHFLRHTERENKTSKQAQQQQQQQQQQ